MAIDWQQPVKIPARGQEPEKPVRVLVTDRNGGAVYGGPPVVGLISESIGGEMVETIGEWLMDGTMPGNPLNDLVQA